MRMSTNIQKTYMTCKVFKKIVRKVLGSKPLNCLVDFYSKSINTIRPFTVLQLR